LVCSCRLVVEEVAVVENQHHREYEVAQGDEVVTEHRGQDQECDHDQRKVLEQQLPTVLGKPKHCSLLFYLFRYLLEGVLWPDSLEFPITLDELFGLF
jgi:hypothetical protein